MEVPDTKEAACPPLLVGEQGCFYVGGRYEDSGKGVHCVGQMYVEYQVPAKPGSALDGSRTLPPVVFIHGGGHTGVCWQMTPDGRPGWAQYFLRNGWPVYVVDQPGRGRSPTPVGAYGEIAQGPSVQKARENWAASEETAEQQWPQAKLHTRWPGGSLPGNPVFDQYFAHLSPSIADQALQEELTTRALIALLERIGPAVLVAHSQPGPAVWRATDLRPELVRAIVALEPTGPPFYDRGHDAEQLDRPFGISRGALTYEPPIFGSSNLQMALQPMPDAPGLMACWLQAEPVRRLPRLAGRPILFLLSESSYHAPYDHCTSQYLKQAGVENELVRLTDIGFQGNGHLMLIEENSLDIAAWVEQWLVRRLAGLQSKQNASS